MDDHYGPCLGKYEVHSTMLVDPHDILCTPICVSPSLLLGLIPLTSTVSEGLVSDSTLHSHLHAVIYEVCIDLFGGPIL